MIELEGVTKCYGELVALDGLDLTVSAGECFGFIGPNGAGKTTTIKILSTLLAPTEGRARVGGIDVREDPEQVRRLIGYMPDFFGIYDNLKVWEYLDFFAGAYQVPVARRKTIVRDVLDLTDLRGKADALVESLSRGMKQRLCLAKTLIHEPKVLLLDEPASGLDPRARIEMRELLAELGRMGKTIFISSHILSELAELCDSVGIVEKGHLVAAGSVEDLSRRMSSKCIVEIEVLGDPEGLRDRMQGREDVLEAAVEEGTVVATLAGAREDIPDLVGELLAGGARIVEFRVRSHDLEDIFMQVTKGEVA